MFFVLTVGVVERNLFPTWTNEACAFPFTYAGVTYQGCTMANGRDTPWCSYDSIYNGDWDYCIEEQGKYSRCPNMMIIHNNINSLNVCRNNISVYSIIRFKGGGTKQLFRFVFSDI